MLTTIYTIYIYNAGRERERATGFHIIPAPKPLFVCAYMSRGTLNDPCNDDDARRKYNRSQDPRPNAVFYTTTYFKGYMNIFCYS